MSSPLDTDKLESLLNDRDLLVSSLEYKQVPASSSETMTSLVSKVDDVLTGLLESDNYFGTVSMNSNQSEKVKTHILSIFDTPQEDILQFLLNGVGGLGNTFAGVVSVHFKSSYTYGAYGLSSICENLKYLVDVKFDDNLNLSNCTSMYDMFKDCRSLPTVNLSMLDTSSITTMSGMFSGCASLESVNLRGLNTSKVTSFLQMFLFCENLTSVDLTGFTFSGTKTEINGMFYGCNKLMYINLSTFDFANTTFGSINSFLHGVPYKCNIIVKDRGSKDWFTNNFPSYTNVEIVGDNV